MRTLITVAAALAMLVGGQAYGQYTVTYTVELGGNNGAAAYHTGAFPQYVRLANGDQDGKTYNVGDILDWAVVVAVTGTNGDGVPSAGAANLVFDLELHEGTADGPLVAIGRTNDPATVGGFFSTILDGQPVAGEANPTENAAFASAFDIDGDNNGTPDGANGGRLWDTLTSGGPNLDFYTYPSTAGYPAASTAAQGTLVGMGAGYKELTWGGKTADQDRVGVGIADETTYCAALGVKALFEGQISTAGLTGNGTTYVLVLKAGTGNNVVPGDTEQFPICDPGISGGKFAIAASTVSGDTISFTLAGGCQVQAPVMTAAKSVKSHGGTEFAVDLFAKEVEPRIDGPTKVVVTFDRAIRLVTNTAADVAVTAGTVSAVAVNGAELTVTMSGVASGTQSTMSFPGVADAQTCEVAASTSTLCMATLLGDFDNSASVNVVDLITVRNLQNKVLDATNFRADVDADGSFNVVDLITVRNMQNKLVTVCP